MVPLAASTIATALARSFDQNPGYDESFSTTSIETTATKPKADAPPMSNGVMAIPMAGSSSVMRKRMLCGAINPAPEAYKLFHLSGQGHAYDVSLPSGSTILPFTTPKENIRTSKMRSCVSCAPDEPHRTFDPEGSASITKAESSGVLCMGLTRVGF